MVVQVENLQKKLRLNLPQINLLAKSILRHENAKEVIVTFAFVDAAQIKQMNKRYLKRNYATDVLAFNLSEEDSKELIGDIIISTDAAINNAKKYGQQVGRELSLYIVHGILHLLGFDDHFLKDVKVMRKKEKELLEVIESKIKTVLLPR